MRSIVFGLAAPLAGVLAASLAAPAAAEPPTGPDAALAGLWESEPVIGLASALWLSPGGEAVWATCLVADGTYEAKAGRLAVRDRDVPEAERTPEAEEAELGTFAGAAWTRKEGDETVVRERVDGVRGGAGADVRGVWRRMHGLGRLSYERFDAGGAWALRIQVGPGSAGRWAPDGDAVLVAWADGTRSRLRVDGAALRASLGILGETAFARRGSENWYALAESPVLFAEGRTPSRDPEAVGLWESAGRSGGGIGSSLWLDPSGHAYSGMVQGGDGTYEVRGKRLVLLVGSEGPPEMDLGDVGPATWTQKVEGRVFVRERLAPPGGTGVVGVWRVALPTGRLGYERFGTNGAWRLRVPIAPTRVGTWSRDGTRVTLRFLGEPAGVLRLEGRSLFEDPEGKEGESKEARAKRVSADDWYALSGSMTLPPARER